MFGEWPSELEVLGSILGDFNVCVALALNTRTTEH